MGRGVPSESDTPGRDEEAVRRFVENFAVTMSDAGFPRMPARVFVATMAAESGTRTAAELADYLQVSPAAISGAVRYLIQINMMTREREPGARRDHYAIPDDVWYETLSRRDQILEQWQDGLQDGVRVMGPDSQAGKRLHQMSEFFQFLLREMPKLYEKWRTESRHDL